MSIRSARSFSYLRADSWWRPHAARCRSNRDSPTGIDEAIPIAKPVAAALEAAHEQGKVRRQPDTMLRYSASENAHSVSVRTAPDAAMASIVLAYASLLGASLIVTQS